MTKAFKCASEFAKWAAKHELITDLFIYVDGIRYTVDKDGKLKYNIDADAKDFLEFAGDFMSVSTEGELYDVINYDYEYECYEKLTAEMNKIFSKYGYYYELGNAWNFSLHEI